MTETSKLKMILITLNVLSAIITSEDIKMCDIESIITRDMGLFNCFGSLGKKYVL